MKRFFIVFGSVGLLIAIGVTLILYFKPHRNIRNAKADFVVNASDWLREFSTNDTLAHRHYFEKVVDITGTPYAVTPADTLTQLQFEQKGVNFSMSCLLHPEQKEIPAVGKPLTVRCFYKGYLQADPDFELPGDIKCVECIILNP